MQAETLTYKPQGVDDTTDAKYRLALARIPRWVVNGEILSKIPESNLNHIDGMAAIVNEIEENFPALTKCFDLETVREMVYFHDAGEIITGDEAISNENYAKNKERRWERERIAVGILTREPNVSDPLLRKKLRDIYARYNSCRPERMIELTDKESLFTHLVDKIQAGRFGLENVFDNHNSSIKATKLIAQFSGLLFNALPQDNIDARNELVLLTQQELNRFRDHGFIQQADAAWKDFCDKTTTIV